MWEFGSIFLKEVSLSLQEKQLMVFVASDKFKPAGENILFGKLISTNLSLKASQYLKAFRMCQCLEDLYNLGKQYFPND